MAGKPMLGAGRTGVCDFCSTNVPVDNLRTAVTVQNGVEQKERACPNCETEAREIEKPVARPDSEADTYDAGSNHNKRDRNGT